MGHILEVVQRLRYGLLLAFAAFTRYSTQLCSGSDVIHVDVMGSHIVILNSMKSANELLEKRSSIYSDRYD
jgi:hypothetical protein